MHTHRIRCVAKWFIPPIAVWPSGLYHRSLCGQVVYTTDRCVAKWFIPPIAVWPSGLYHRSLCAQVVYTTDRCVPKWFIPPIAVWPSGLYRRLNGDFDDLFNIRDNYVAVPTGKAITMILFGRRFLKFDS